MLRTQIDLKTAPGHQVLAAAGKQVLRPGGLTATEQLFSWANFQPDMTVLELAASFGTSAITLAQRYGVRVVGIEKNLASVAQARSNVAAAGLSDRIQILNCDIFRLNQLTEQFDYVLAEAILTMQSESGKARLLSEIYDCLKPGGQFLSHELRVSGTETDLIHRELSSTIRVNASPMPTEDWISACEVAGFTVKQHTTGPMTLLNPKYIVQEEGLPTLLTMGWNMMTRPVLRQRIFSMRKTFKDHSEELGYLVLIAQKEM